MGEREGQPAWRDVLARLQGRNRKQYLRLSRKMLNHLCSIGLVEAQEMLDAVEDAPVDSPSSPLSSGAPFALADEYLGDDEILTRLQKWMRDDDASFFSTVVGDSRAPMPEIAEAIRRFTDVLSPDVKLAPSTAKSLRVSLIQRFLTEQLAFINVAKEVVRITDFAELIDRVVMTSGSHGKLGGKGAGLLLAKWILEEPELEATGLSGIRTPRTWYIISDAIMDFVRLNQLDDVMEQKFKDIGQVRREYPNLIRLFKSSSFPPEIITGLSKALDYFGEVPLILRSSSLLEDRFGTAFSGKYKSLFLANQGTKKERLEATLEAVAEIWASVLGPDPIEYRRERGLTEFIEEMGVLVQEVVGTRLGRYYLPAFAGVAFSNNEFRWSPRIQREDGLVRLVPGLGTRAVDRLGDDFPILAVPGQPGLRANSTVDEVLRYSPNLVDVIDLEANRFATVPLADLLAEAGNDYPLRDQVFSVYENGRLEHRNRFVMDAETQEWVADMEGLLRGEAFVKQAQALMTTLASYLDAPVDIEFAHDGKDFYLLQCRPQAQASETAPAPIPRDVPPGDLIFQARRFVSNGWVPEITHVVYVDGDAYAALPSLDAMQEVGRAVGRLNQRLPKKRFILIGPGRWGSRGDIKLGVPVTYADINNTAMLIEVARQRGEYLPDLSFGTHFFQDLVEAEIRYLPLYPDTDDVAFNEEFLTGSGNLLPELLPEFAHLADVVRVNDVRRAADGRVLKVALNADLDEAVALLAEPSGEVQRQPDATAPVLHEPRQFWRWRYRMTERMVRALDPDRFGVVAVYLVGSVKNGTARPDSDIDVLVHFRGDAAQHRVLHSWFTGWSQALSEMNYSRTGMRVDPMLDIVYLSDEEVDAREGPAAMIGAVTNAARLLEFG